MSELTHGYTGRLGHVQEDCETVKRLVRVDTLEDLERPRQWLKGFGQCYCVHGTPLHMLPS